MAASKNPTTRLVKVKYEAIIELDEAVEGIDDGSPLFKSNAILATGISAVMGPKFRGLYKPSRFTVGIYFPPKPRNRKKKKS